MDLVLALIASFIAAFIPTCIYVVLAWWLDRYEKEPIWLLTITFLWGAIPAIILSLVAEILLDIPVQAFVIGQGADLISTAVIAPLVEEIAKAFPLLLIFWLYRHEFDGLMDGLIYGALVGFGFAMTENVFYFIGAYDEGGWEAWGILVFLRAIIFGLNHALFTSATGVGLAYARHTKNTALRWLAPAIGLAVSIVLHMIHNFFVSWEDAPLLCLISLGTDWLGVLVWLGLMVFAARQEREWIREELAEEVEQGRLPLEHAQAAARYRTRLRERWAAFRERGWGQAHRLSLLHHAAAELAIKKRHYRLHGDEKGNAKRIETLRAQVVKLVNEL